MPNGGKRGHGAAGWRLNTEITQWTVRAPPLGSPTPCGTCVRVSLGRGYQTRERAPHHPQQDRELASTERTYLLGWAPFQGHPLPGIWAGGGILTLESLFKRWRSMNLGNFSLLGVQNMSTSRVVGFLKKKFERCPGSGLGCNPLDLSAPGQGAWQLLRGGNSKPLVN